jgi:hypothetical protein
MAFLTLNGWNPGTLKGGDQTFAISGDNEPAYDGTPLRDRRITKRRWAFETPTLDRESAEALASLLLGRGYTFPFDADLFADLKGLGPVGSTSGNIRQGTAADGATIYSALGETEAKYGAGALAVEPALTNLLTATAATASDHNVFTILGVSTLATSTARYCFGASSVSSTAASPNDGVRSPSAAISASTAYSAQVHVYSPTAEFTVVRLVDNVGQVAATTIQTVAGGWVRATVSGTSAVGASSAWTEVYTLSGGSTFFIDGLQIEQSAAPTTWYLPGSPAVGASDLEYPPAALGSYGYTLAGWLSPPGEATASRTVGATFFDARSTTSADRVHVTLNHATHLSLRATVYEADGTSTNLDYTSGAAWADWAHVAVVYRPKQSASDSAKIELYVDGVLRASATGGNYPRGADFANLYVGHSSGSSYWEGTIDDLRLLPFAAPAAMLAGLAAATTAQASAPRITLAGDLTLDESVEVIGIDPANRYFGQHLTGGGGWRSDHQRIKFALESVQDWGG